MKDWYAPPAPYEVKERTLWFPTPWLRITLCLHYMLVWWRHTDDQADLEDVVLISQRWYMFYLFGLGIQVRVWRRESTIKVRKTFPNTLGFMIPSPRPYLDEAIGEAIGEFEMSIRQSMQANIEKRMFDGEPTTEMTGLTEGSDEGSK